MAAQGKAVGNFNALVVDDESTSSFCREVGYGFEVGWAVFLLAAVLRLALSWLRLRF